MPHLGRGQKHAQQLQQQLPHHHCDLPPQAVRSVAHEQEAEAGVTAQVVSLRVRQVQHHARHAQRPQRQQNASQHHGDGVLPLETGHTGVGLQEVLPLVIRPQTVEHLEQVFADSAVQDEQIDDTDAHPDLLGAENAAALSAAAAASAAADAGEVEKHQH